MNEIIQLKSTKESCLNLVEKCKAVSSTTQAQLARLKFELCE